MCGDNVEFLHKFLPNKVSKIIVDQIFNVKKSPSNEIITRFKNFSTLLNTRIIPDNLV